MPSLFFVLIKIVLFLFASFVTGTLIVPRQSTNGGDGIHLAVRPQCGPLSGSVSDVNAGLDLSNIKTIVSFGVGNLAIIVFSPCD
jgi:hypothetical protein